ncbi:hypothetical protein KKF05_04800 [Patescibacteria group bacterium]|nr:hypothetical protein [Patescibacteria group bacterium]MBU1029162.1 hypothetical protein [Patescibacteria group bacterium]MBU1916070.1 hypothetical protein [Patescibacteria group bacterium]
MSKVKAFLSLFVTRPRLGYVAVFLLPLALYTLIQLQPSFKDPDSFYHAGITRLIVQQIAPVTEFPWLPFTTLADTFADQHFFYHLLLIPFGWLFGSLAGLKVAAVIFGAAAITAFYFAARSLRLHSILPLVLATVLATSMNFMFRLNLAKAASLSVVLLMLGVAALARRNWLALAGLSFIYVWAHGSWPLLIFITVCFWLTEKEPQKLFKKERLILPIASIGGTLAGLIINPFFPQNLLFYWYQTVHAALINYADVINVGQEWLPYEPSSLFRQNGSVFLLLIIAAVVWLSARLWQEQVRRSVVPTDWPERCSHVFALAIISIVFLLLAIKSQRHVEYFVPFALLLAGASFDLLFRRFNLRRLWQLSFGGSQRFVAVAGLFLCLVFPLLAIRDVYLVTKSFHWDKPSTPWTRFESATSWMQLHLPVDAMVFHGNWADFPALFYRAPEFHYIAGLDPTFLYLKDPARFIAWRAAVENRTPDLSAVVKSFDAQYVLVRKVEADFRSAVEADNDFRLVYEDEEVQIFMLFP